MKIYRILIQYTLHKTHRSMQTSEKETHRKTTKEEGLKVFMTLRLMSDTDNSHCISGKTKKTGEMREDWLK